MLKYARQWRRKHPTYMRDYGRKYYAEHYKRK